MPDLTPEQIDAQNTAKRRLRAIREEGITYQSRRDDEIAMARAAGLSYREIAREVGLTASSISDHLHAMGLGGPIEAVEE